MGKLRECYLFEVLLNHKAKDIENYTENYQGALYHFSKVMTDLVDYSKAQFRSRTGIALLDVSHDY